MTATAVFSVCIKTDYRIKRKRQHRKQQTHPFAHCCTHFGATTLYSVLQRGKGAERAVQGRDGAPLHVETLRGEGPRQHLVSVRNLYDDRPHHGKAALLSSTSSISSDRLREREGLQTERNGDGSLQSRVYPCDHAIDLISNVRGALRFLSVRATVPPSSTCVWYIGRCDEGRGRAAVGPWILEG